MLFMMSLCIFHHTHVPYTQLHTLLLTTNDIHSFSLSTCLLVYIAHNSFLYRAFVVVYADLSLAFVVRTHSIHSAQ